MDILGWIKSHPLSTAGGVVAVGFVFLMLNRPQQSGDGGMSAFYAAQAAQKQSGDSVMVAQMQANVATAGIGAQAETQKYWADKQLAATQSNNTTRVQLAPYQLRGMYLETAAEISRQPAITQTTQSSKRGLFGGKSSTTTTVLPNPAWDFLDSVEQFMLTFDTGNSPAALTYNP